VIPINIIGIFLSLIGMAICTFGIVYDIYHPRKKEEIEGATVATDDGYIIIDPRPECCDVEIIRVHEKGKVYYPNVQMRMGLSDVEFIHGTGENKRTWKETIHIQTSEYRLRPIIKRLMELM